MNRISQFDALKEIQEQLASDKRRLGFLLGAGSSMAVGLPGIENLTSKVESNVSENSKKIIQLIKEKNRDQTVNIETILSKVRLCCELFENDKVSEYCGIKGEKSAKDLDIEICKQIRKIILETEVNSKTPHRIFSQWIKALHSARMSPIEIFTLNYDLLLEESMENIGVPFFDGFIGSYRPFFAPESVDLEYGDENNHFYPPIGWTRIWKLHGSINWYSIIQEHEIVITRSGLSYDDEGKDLMIFPSLEKYSQSRKLPFITYQDRLRKFLVKGETLLVICGYSFLDQHINEILFQGLRSNPRLSIIALIFGNNQEKEKKRVTPNFILDYGLKFKNLTIVGPDLISVGGIKEYWKNINQIDNNEVAKFWDGENFTLGDFNTFTAFLEYYFHRSSFLMDDNTPVTTSEK